MDIDYHWSPENFVLDLRHGYLEGAARSPHHHQPQVIVNDERISVLRVLRDELRRCREFYFSVAFVSPQAIALIKQELVDFHGAGRTGRIVTSDYLSFNSPRAFAELLNLRPLGVDVRIHSSRAFHPKGYIFDHGSTVTAMVGSSNLTASAITSNDEWNLKVSATPMSDLGAQFADVMRHQLDNTSVLTQTWIDAYEKNWVAPSRRAPGAPPPALASTPDDAETFSPLEGQLTDRGGATAYRPPVPERDELEFHGGEVTATTTQRSGVSESALPDFILPNAMQREALEAIKAVRDEGHRKAIVISATGTGKTMLSALDVRAVDPARFMFIVHREQILDRTMQEYRRVLGGPASDYGKLTGNFKQGDRRYVFASIQTLAKDATLRSHAPTDFDYIVLDEAHRAGAPTYRQVLAHFDPAFLLGMTATPERRDGVNVFELFDYNVPYEIRLGKALEEDMLSPFHYYGIADVTLDDGRTVDVGTSIAGLTDPKRVQRILWSMKTYGQAGVSPRGLIFCSRNAEAQALSETLNTHTLHGRPLRTLALSGSDDIPAREAAVARLERGELDYLLTVDIFNEGVDIPSINQVILLRATESAVVFVQQLGRGLRKAPGKEYLVVVDFIGNYANNFMIPIALFGDESLNKESLRKNLIAAEEKGVLPGLSSVRFDRISQARVLEAVTSSSLDSMQRLKVVMEAMRNRVGGVPDLWDFHRFESADPVLLATRRGHYLELVRATLKVEHNLTVSESKALQLLSEEVMAAKRLHEFVLVEALLERASLSTEEIASVFRDAGLSADAGVVTGALATLTLANHSEADRKRYGRAFVDQTYDGRVEIRADLRQSYEDSHQFNHAVTDLLHTGKDIVAREYQLDRVFTVGRQYSRKEVARLLNWDRKGAQTIYGYRVDKKTQTCPIFVTLHKADDVSASTAYQDELLDVSNMRWFTRSRRTLQSAEVDAIVKNEVDLYVFVKKDDAEGIDFYFLGQATAHDAQQQVMDGDGGKKLDVVTMRLQFEAPIESALYDYFHPAVTG